MIDTIDLFYTFPNRDTYNQCYKSIDYLSRQSCGQALHKASNKKNYITTAFASVGILQVAFRKTHYRRACYIMLKPARLLQPNSHIRLATASDFAEVCCRMNFFIDSINRQSNENLLPHIQKWHVQRIDYAVNIETPHTDKYIRLFQAGAIPNGFSAPKKLYPTSCYLKSKNGNINFYDKIAQLQEQHDISTQALAAELLSVSPGFLRIEFQCSNKRVLHIKEHYGLLDTTLQSLWRADIATDELHYRINSLIGKENFFLYNGATAILAEYYGRRTLSRCCHIMRLLKDSSDATLDSVQRIVAPGRKNDFAQLLNKIRNVGVNPIPLEVAYRDTDEPLDLAYLINPYNMIHCS